MKYKIILLALPLMLAIAQFAAVPASAEEAPSSQDTDTKTLLWADGTRYVGGVLDGKRSGKGTIYWQDGTRFVGTFKDDLRNGPGTMILPDGSVYNGFFKDDKLVEAPAEPGDPDSTEVAQATIELEQAGKDAALAAAAAAPVDPANTVTTMTEAVKAELITMVDLWAAAWSEQNVVQYLDYYSEDFKVPGNQSRRSWEALRRSRIMRPGSIDIKVTYDKFEVVKPDVVDVYFKQAYTSDVYSDVGNKVLRLQKETPYWRIIDEQSR